MIWLTALRRVTIISSPSSTTESAKARSSRASGSAAAVALQHDDHRQRDQPDAEQHGRTDADDRLDLAVDAEPHDDPVQRDRNDDGLEHQRDRRRDVEMRRILDVRLPGDRQREHDRVQREDVEQPEHAVLIEQHEADQHQAAGQHMRDIEGQ